ncbi:pirin family protein [Staphylococcus sp. SQ8-PEA]|uniref:Pirin family protein n=1 Tax=Staphylococcus marylandisciuri TaxID=2981529 RepID=A0ABT2QRE4_9STAP|nr:pirin family protein [Staphylococcus marylandisciuri]MCU5746522.1 pirin family protein [Staphylococcus marylandisciuri]
MNILKKDQVFPQGNHMFSIKLIRPGLIWQDPELDDYAFGPLSRIDHANLAKGTLVRMHEHVNDEILSYIWKGNMLHEDSTGKKVTISPAKYMMMGAGKSFFHEESTPNESVEMLQIFIRPREKDLEPEVQFSSAEIKSNNDWNLVAGPENIDPPLTIRQDVIVMDYHGKKNDVIEVPQYDGMTPWLYVMDGSINISNQTLDKGEAITTEDSDFSEVKLLKDTTLVLFLVDLNAPMTLAGNFSGVKK